MGYNPSRRGDLRPGSPFAVAIPNDQIGVRADSDCPLARIETEDLGRLGCGKRDELIERQAIFSDPFREEQRQTCLEPWQALRDSIEWSARPEREP